MPRILSNEMDAAAEKLADRIEPILKDTFFRTEGLVFKFDVGQWETLIAALCEKLPKRLAKLPLSKDDRMELLTVIDGIDRTVRAKGSLETAETMLKALTAMFDLFGSFRGFLKLKILQDGVDITEDIFGE